MAETPPEEQPIVVKKVIKKGGHGGHHGGAWKVAYADFVTAMMCLFLLLWLVNVDPSTKEIIAEFFKQQPIQGGPLQGNIFIFGGAKSPSDPGSFEGGASFMQFERKILTEQNKREIAKQIKKEFKRDLEVNADSELFKKVEFNLTEDGIMIELKASDALPLFQSGSSSLTKEAMLIIDKLAVAIRKKSAPITIAGHTDSVRYGYGNYDNWDLSVDRANSVRKRMVYGGVDRERVRRIEGYSDTQLKNPGDPLDVSNRRIAILLLQKDKVDNLKPKYLDLDEEYDHIESEKYHEAKAKVRGSSHGVSHSLHSTSGKKYKPVTLDDLRRKKARGEHRAAHPVQAPSSGGGH